MTTMREKAKALAARGFRVFPLNGKIPTMPDFVSIATSKGSKIDLTWYDDVLELEHHFNVGISTYQLGADKFLCAVDVDNKHGKKGMESVFKLATEGKTLPKTLTQKTPTGGLHYIYWTRVPVRNRVGIWPDVDIRGKGGFIVGAGSIVEAGEYDMIEHPIVEAPDWLVEEIGEAPKGSPDQLDASNYEDIDQDRAMKRAENWLTSHAPIAVQGQGGDATTYNVCCELKDIGLNPSNALEAVLEFWNDRCEPPWDPKDLTYKITNAYKYGQDRAGAHSVEKVFDPVPIDENQKKDPIDELNEEYAYCLTGNSKSILRETTDDKGRPAIKFMTLRSLEEFHASKKLHMGGKRAVPLIEAWMESDRRRTYEGIAFAPGRNIDKKLYNLWRGFSVTPYDTPGDAPEEAHEGLRMFLEHCLENVCNGNEIENEWVLSWFAHLFQKPEEKPLTSLVIRGKQGTGKTAFVNIFGQLVRNHYLVASDERYLLSNFNSHLENTILMILDEATGWAGRKSVEGKLKELVTGASHIIERKGQEPYTVDNLSRIVILSNELHAVPAALDDRRFTALTIGNKRILDNSYFAKMKYLMERGGYRLLLRYLLDFKIKIDINESLKTRTLLDQKLQSAGVIDQWWVGSLNAGQLLGESDYGSIEFPKQVKRSRVLAAIQEYTRSRNIRSWGFDELSLTKKLSEICPSIKSKRVRGDGDRQRVYIFPSIEVARKEYEQRIGQKIDWESLEFEGGEQ